MTGMEQVAETLKMVCWVMNAFGIVVVIATRIGWHTKVGWAANGGLLLLIAIGNALVLSAADLRPGEQGASLFGLVVLGSLGSRFIGNWVTDGAT